MHLRAACMGTESLAPWRSIHAHPTTALTTLRHYVHGTHTRPTPPHQHPTKQPRASMASPSLHRQSSQHQHHAALASPPAFLLNRGPILCLRTTWGSASVCVCVCVCMALQTGRYLSRSFLRRKCLNARCTPTRTRTFWNSSMAVTSSMVAGVGTSAFSVHFLINLRRILPDRVCVHVCVRVDSDVNIHGQTTPTPPDQPTGAPTFGSLLTP